MKQQPYLHQPNQEKKRTQNVSNSANNATIEHRTYKPRTPITKTTIAIMNDPFVFSC